ncbi:RNA 2',3'-cyclic phosphodiesterase, partial [Candidatus Pacearchaeota archaeon CG10_big_fil_rev_8_21_14_0_10_32_14]
AFEKVKEANLVRGKFVEKENLHLTLKFFGELTNDQVKKVEDALAKINFSSFDCEVGEVGVFPHPNHPKVVWVSLKSDSDEFKTLYESIDKSTKKMGFAESEDKFESHVTTLRLYVVKSKEMFDKKLSEIHFKNIIFKIDSFSLIKSELTNQGPIYKTLKKFSLKN